MNIWLTNLTKHCIQQMQNIHVLSTYKSFIEIDRLTGYQANFSTFQRIHTILWWVTVKWIFNFLILSTGHWSEYPKYLYIKFYPSKNPIRFLDLFHFQAGPVHPSLGNLRFHFYKVKTTTRMNDNDCKCEYKYCYLSTLNSTLILCFVYYQ